LLLRELALLHDMTSFPSSEKSCRKNLFHSVNSRFEIRGQGHDGSMPMESVSMVAASLKTSPNILPVTTMSKRLEALTSC
jgi:hypothetical protein